MNMLITAAITVFKLKYSVAPYRQETPIVASKDDSIFFMSWVLFLKLKLK